MASAGPPTSLLDSDSAEPCAWDMRWVTGRDGLTDLALDWNRLDRYATSPIEQYAWISACAATFATPDELRIATVWDGAQLMAAAPVVMRRSGPFRQARLLGVSELQEPMDVAWSDPIARFAGGATRAFESSVEFRTHRRGVHHGRRLAACLPRACLLAGASQAGLPDDRA